VEKSIRAEQKFYLHFNSIDSPVIQKLANLCYNSLAILGIWSWFGATPTTVARTQHYSNDSSEGERRR
jgi:hypothetical protein